MHTKVFFNIEFPGERDKSQEDKSLKIKVNKSYIQKYDGGQYVITPKGFQSNVDNLMALIYPGRFNQDLATEYRIALLDHQLNYRKSKGGKLKDFLDVIRNGIEQKGSKNPEGKTYLEYQLIKEWLENLEQEGKYENLVYRIKWKDGKEIFLDLVHKSQTREKTVSVSIPGNNQAS